ncbi:thymidine kinase [Thalassotalea ganghwensis]
MAQLYFYYSTMNAGKSTHLLQSSYNYRERGQTTLLYTAKIDDRFAKGKVASRIGLQQDAELFEPDTELFEQISEQHLKQKLDCVLIDEAQFLTKEQVKQLTLVVDRLNIPVLAYGIRTDFLGELFEGSSALLAWADKLVELKTICHCGKKANFVIRRDSQGRPVNQGQQIDVGGNEKYESLCRQHFREFIWD